MSCCALESTTQWRLSAIKVKLELELQFGVYFWHTLDTKFYLWLLPVYYF